MNAVTDAATASVAGPPERLKLTEIFLSLQGEARDAGWPTVFVRLTGCPLRCTYCDTTYSFHGGQWWEIDAILAEVARLGAKHVCVTGGEPLSQKRCLTLLERLCNAGHVVSLETSGAIDIAGRVLGLLGVTQLRRRLSLDFSDFFAKGFAFDRVQGNAQLSQGTLRTEDLVMKGPAADIHLRGSTDLRLQRFDQTVDVLPKSGGLLTAVGALAGGPVGAAVGAVANAVLDKPMQGLGAKTYRVTGPWSSPKVETLDRKAADADARKRAD